MKSAGKFAKHLLIAGLVILTSFSVAEAQRGGRGGSGGRSFGGGGRSFGGGGSPRISSVPRSGFGGGNRIAVGPRYTPNRNFGGIRGNINIGPVYRGNYGRPYYGGGYGRPGFGGYGYGAYYRGYFPRIGFYLNVLPFGYYPFSYGGYPYYYNEGLFYQQYNSGYQVVAPPIGAEVPRLPRGTQDITIDGQQYFEKDGVYYQKVIDENGKKAYRVAGKDGVLNTDGNAGQDDQQTYDNNSDQQPSYNQVPQQNSNPLPKVGDVVNTIPSESRPVTINGEKLFISPDGVYYQEDNSGNNRIFKVVGVSTTDGTSDTISNP